MERPSNTPLSRSAEILCRHLEAESGKSREELVGSPGELWTSEWFNPATVGRDDGGADRGALWNGIAAAIEKGDATALQWALARAGRRNSVVVLSEVLPAYREMLNGAA